MAKLARFSALHQPAKKVTKRRVVVVVAPPPPSGDIVGTITVGQSSGNYGYGATNPVMGSMTQNPAGVINLINYGSFGGSLSFNGGVYFGPNGNFTSTGTSFNTSQGSGRNQISLTIDGITTTITFDGMSWSDPGSDRFGFINKVGQTLNFSITIL